jgi:HRDC domain
MRVSVTTLRYSSLLGAIDDSPLTSLLRDRAVSGFREHFFVAEGVPHVFCVVEWKETPPAIASSTPARSSEPRPANVPSAAGTPEFKDLADGERALFATIREWRVRRAERDGVPPYLILTNKELIRLVRARPATKSALAAIDGIGKAKVERYGDELLEFARPRENADAGSTSQPKATTAATSVAAPDAVLATSNEAVAP